MSALPMPNHDPFAQPARRRTETVVVTPEVAARLLGRQDPNRRSSKRLVETIADDIRSGNWVHNGETICISATGRVLDGRHRLSAVVLAGLPITTEVAFGVPDGAFASYDQGKKRSGSDVLGIRGEVNTTTLAAVVGLVLLEEAGLLRYAGAGGWGFSTGEIVAGLDRHPGLREAVHRTRSEWHASPDLLTSRVAAWCAYRFVATDPDAATEWFSGLCSGANLAVGSPILALRKRLIDRKSTKLRIATNLILAIAIKSFNAYRKGQSMKALSWRSDGPSAEDFPEIDP